MAEDDDERLRSNLDRLKTSLNRARVTQGPPPAAEGRRPVDDAPRDSGVSLGLRAGSEFVSAIVVGAGIGWGIDRLLGTNPAFLIVFFMLGVAAGVWGVIRLTSPKGGMATSDSRLSPANVADKGTPRSVPAAGSGAPQERGAPRRTDEPSGGADDDED